MRPQAIPLATSIAIRKKISFFFYYRYGAALGIRANGAAAMTELTFGAGDSTFDLGESSILGVKRL